MTITPVILAGGGGARLWPVSSPDRPKAFLALTGERTMIQLTAMRASNRTRFGPPLIVASARHEALIVEQLAAIGIVDATLVLEPCGRNSGPAVALAALAADPQDLLLVTPSDHHIGDEAAFLAAIEAGAGAARDGDLVTLGIAPDAPETGYGYIELGDEIGDGAHRAARFVEKPDRAAAEAMLSSGRFLWNSGLFLFSAAACLDAFSRHAPELLRATRAAFDNAERDERRIAPRRADFAAAPDLSFDHAVMEGAERVAVVPVAMDWSDLGSWDSLYEAAAKDGAGNTLSASALAIDSRGTLVRAEGIEVTAVGVEDLVIVASGGKLLVMPRGTSQRVREAGEARRSDPAP